MFKQLIFVSTFIFSQLVNASIPTMEGLFRNPNNKDVNTEFTIITFQIEENTLAQGNAEADGAALSSEITKPLYLKMILRKTKKDQLKLYRFFYDNGSLNESAIVKFDQSGNLTKKVSSSSTFSQAAFNSLVAMITFNRSKEISSTLKKYDNSFVFNKEIMNPEKMSLFSKYKRYLVGRKNSDSSSNEGPSPLRPEGEEESLKVKETLKERMYTLKNNIRLIKDGNDFYWNLKLEKFDITFDQETHRLNKLLFTEKDSNLEVFIKFGNFVLLNGEHEIPQNIIIQNEQRKIYKIRTLGFKAVDISEKGFDKLLKKSIESLQERKKEVTFTGAEIEYPQFLQ